MLCHQLQSMISGRPVLTKVFSTRHSPSTKYTTGYNKYSYLVTCVLTEEGSIAVLVESPSKETKYGWMHRGGVLAEYYNPGDVDRLIGPRKEPGSTPSWLDKIRFTKMCKKWLQQWNSRQC